MMFSNDDRFEAHPDTVARVLEGELVMLELNTGMYFGMNEVGARVWEIVTDDKSFAEVVAVLLDEFDVDEKTLRDDVSELLTELIERQLLRSVEK